MLKNIMVNRIKHIGHSAPFDPLNSSLPQHIPICLLKHTHLRAKHGAHLHLNYLLSRVLCKLKITMNSIGELQEDSSILSHSLEFHDTTILNAFAKKQVSHTSKAFDVWFRSVLVSHQKVVSQALCKHPAMGTCRQYKQEMGFHLATLCRPHLLE